VAEPKTEAGVRYVALPGLVVSALRKHQLRTRLVTGTPVVFPYNLRRFRSGVFFRATRSAGLRRIKLHDLRRTAASIMIAAKNPIASVSAQLGHKNMGITLGTHAHEIEAANEEDSVAARTEAYINAQGGGVGSVSALSVGANAQGAA
jgi:integrase